MERIDLYTDGGCRGNGKENNVGAWAFRLEYWVDEELKAVKEDSEGMTDTTNNVQELRGMINGLKAINNKEIEVRAFSDSAYVLNGITSWIEGWKKKGWINSKKEKVANKELWIELDKLKHEFMNLNFVKVKGHSDNEGNNRVDKLLNDTMDNIDKEDKDVEVVQVGVKQSKVVDKKSISASCRDSVLKKIKELEENGEIEKLESLKILVENFE